MGFFGEFFGFLCTSMLKRKCAFMYKCEYEMWNVKWSLVGTLGRRWMANLQLFQLFLHFLGHSSHCLCPRRTLFCCLDSRVQWTERQGMVMWLNCQCFCTTVHGTHPRWWCWKWCLKWDRFAANWNRSENQKDISKRWKATSWQTLSLHICTFVKSIGALVRSLIRPYIALASWTLGRTCGAWFAPEMH